MIEESVRTPTVSGRARSTPASPIRKLTPYADAARARGTSVFQMNIGQPDFPTPSPILQAVQSFPRSVLAYAPSSGLPEARAAWSEYYRRQGFEVPEEEVLVTIGGSEAIQFAIAAVADPGDNILVFEPTYTNYVGFAAGTSVELKPIALDASNGYALPSLEEVARAVDPRTRALLLCNPNNPTGSVYDASTMSGFVTLAERHGLFLIVDEVYREFVYDGRSRVSVLALAPRSPHVIMVDSVSKRFNACGARVGCFTTANQEVFQGAMRLAQARLSAPTVEQLAVIPMLRDPLPYTIPLVADYQGRRDAVMRHLRVIPGARYSEPQGAFYMVVRLPIDDSEAFARWLLESFSDQGETVFVAPMPGFYVTPGQGRDEVRLAFVLEETRLARAAALLRLGVEQYGQH
ncbi:MAG TPA: pyridoxal phosphate-dependent aminotransferase [Chloroflexota bacterium]|nr:pyridoxal phosphate-dependent aminotransferase [Chloroflexota bacterium]